MRLTEAQVQALARVEASEAGLRIWRNNVGVAFDDKGTPVRFGLANDSKQVNQAIKSADLVGIRPILILPEHVGTTIGQFISRECKASDWRYTGTAREQAQQAWHELINGLGGNSCFLTGRGTF